MVLYRAAEHRLHGEPRSGQGRQPPSRRRVINPGGGSDAVARRGLPADTSAPFDGQKRDNGAGRPQSWPEPTSPHGHHTRREDRIMLWLLATLSAVTALWGIAHRLNAVSPAANCTGERCSCRLDDRP